MTAMRSYLLGAEPWVVLSFVGMAQDQQGAAPALDVQVEARDVAKLGSPCLSLEIYL